MKSVTNADQEYRRIHKYESTHAKISKDSESEVSSDESAGDDSSNGAAAQIDNRFALLNEDD